MVEGSSWRTASVLPKRRRDAEQEAEPDDRASEQWSSDDTRREGGHDHCEIDEADRVINAERGPQPPEAGIVRHRLVGGAGLAFLPAWIYQRVRDDGDRPKIHRGIRRPHVRGDFQALPAPVPLDQVRRDQEGFRLGTAYPTVVLPAEIATNS